MKLNELADELAIVLDGQPKQKLELGKPIDGIAAQLSKDLSNLSLSLTPAIPVDGTVKWSVRMLDLRATELAEGDGFSVEPDLTALSPTFMLAPEVRPHREPPETKRLAKRAITALVRLTARPREAGLDMEDTTATRNLRVDVELDPLPLPTVLALFRHAGFQPSDPTARPRAGAVLIVVPLSSPAAPDPAAIDKDMLGPLDTTLGSLRSLARFASLVSGLKLLRDVFKPGKYPPENILAMAANRIEHLNRITVIDQKGVFRNDIEVEDEMSSLLFIGPKPHQVKLFNARQFREGKGRLDVTIGAELVARINDLHRKPPKAEPGVLNVTERDATYGDNISSLRFREG